MTLPPPGLLSWAPPEGPPPASWLFVGAGSFLLAAAWVRYVKRRHIGISELVEGTVLSLLFIVWPIFTGVGPGPVFSVFFLVLGCWLLARAWVAYVKHREDAKITVPVLVLANLLSLVFIAGGVRGLLHWFGARR